MDGYLKRRLSNPAYGGSSVARLDEDSVYERCVKQQTRTDAHPLQMVRHEASASKNLYHTTDNAKQGPCWDGYRKVEGMADYADNSCVKVKKKGGKDKDKKKSKDKKKKKKKAEGEKSSSDSSDSEDEKKKD